MTMSHRSTRREWLQVAGTAALGLSPLLNARAQAEDGYPNKQIRIIEPLPAGGTPDVVARMYAERLQAITKQSVIIENKPGGLYVLGLQALNAAPADGYTLLHINVSLTTIQASMRKFDLLERVVPVTMAGETTAVLVASMKAPFENVAELVTYAKKNPGKLSYSVGGLGSAEHLVSVMMEKAAGFSAVAVPYKGSIEGTIALMAGDVDYAVLPTPMAVQLMPKGEMRPLAVLSKTRVTQFPDVPTLVEAGLPIEPFSFWGGFAVARGTPTPIVEYLHKTLSQVVKAPELEKRMVALSLEPTVSSSPAAFTSFIRSELERYTTAVKASNLKLG